MYRLLLAEDDPAISRSLAEFLRGEGFGVETVSGQREAEALLTPGRFDLLLVDLSLSDGSGFGVCAAAKALGLPVIFVTASGDEGSVVAGLDMGADDYVAKPFRPRELVSRIRSVLRRCGSQSVLSLGPLRVDTDKALVTKNGVELPLSALEYRILLVFLSNRGRVLTRARLLEEIWDAAGDYVNDNTLTVYIKRLRDKLEEDPQQPALIKTVRGIGYRVDE
ncbi:MAG: response regulator transcription factor [Oscillospiraceae bacterium]|nr:response regulator transcription factor [Oscillospiraceae bacterium]